MFYIYGLPAELPSTQTYSLSAVEGTYALTGKAQTPNAARSLAAAEGTYSLSGKPQALPVALSVLAAEGSYALTGEPQALIYTPLTTGEHSRKFRADIGGLMGG